MPDRDFSARSRPSGKKLAGPLARGSADPAAIQARQKGFLTSRAMSPAQPDIMQVAVGPLRQFAALPNPVAPNVQGVADLLQKNRSHDDLSWYVVEHSENPGRKS